MKLKFIFAIIFISIGTIVSAQGKYITKTGELQFEASVPSFEEVKAKNNSVSAILNSETGEFAVLALIKGFRFRVALMEEHFNENYIESSKFPKATFRGKIAGFDLSELSETNKEQIVSGVLNLHGQDKEMEIPATLSLVDGNILIELDFVLKPGDFNIKIPKIVSSKIAEEINVTAKLLLKK